MLKAAKIAFLLFVFALGFMKPYVYIRGLPAIAADLVYPIAAICAAIAVAAGKVRLRWDPLYGFVLLYFAAMFVSALAAEDPSRAWLKLATQIYLLSLPLLVATLVQTKDELKAVFRTWLAATAVASAVGAFTVLSFFLGDRTPRAGYGVHEFGSLPPGPYVRIESTFQYPAMLCDYLTVSLIILLLSFRIGWIRPLLFWPLLGMLLVTALFTLTPGLGGVFLALGLWGFIFLRPQLGKMTLISAAAAAAIFFLAAAVTPFVTPTAPFLIHVPGTDRVLAPAVRMMTWIDSFHTFVRHPLLGIGIGGDPARVRYIDPSGTLHWPVTDAHNVFLNFAAQCGIVGLAAMILLIAHVAKRTGSAQTDGWGLLRFGLGSAWLIAFAYEGLTGSYEDARHLWVLLGLFIVASRLERPTAAASQDVALHNFA
jgi:O-antigen ligase